MRSTSLPLVNRTILVASLWAMPSCGGTTPLLREGKGPEGGLPGTAVTSFPPPARVEVLPIRRNQECLWQDGYYRPRTTLGKGGGTEWVWTPGAWVLPIENCEYTRPRTLAESSDEGGRIVYFPPAFYDPTTKKTCPAPGECD